MKILVTGGSGTIGRMVCKQLCSQDHEVVVLSRDPGKQLVNCPGMIHEVGRIEDEHFVQHVFRKHEVQGVIHTAANKHISVCEDRPTEAIGANVIGSLNILKALEENCVRRAVFVSSDKACNHGHVYGITKYLMERLVAEYAERFSHTRLNCVRFGNVFGSSGSVIPIWQSKINRGHDIELRTFKHHGAPWRLAILPSEAAAFCVEVLQSPNYSSGSVLFQGGLKEVSLRDLAEIMTEGTRSRINEVPSLSVEAPVESMCSMEEEEFIKSHENGRVYEILRLPVGGQHPCRFNLPMEKEEAREFLKKVLEEAKEWI